jgi:hypothetical protein
MPTKYDELAALAIRNSEEFFQEKSEMENKALFVMREAQAFFEAPEGRLEFVKLSRDLAVEHADGKFPKLVYGHDHSWHFGFRLRFESEEDMAFGVVNLKLALHRLGNQVILKFEREFPINSAEVGSAKEFLEYLHVTLSEDYQKPACSPKRHIGFHD